VDRFLVRKEIGFYGLARLKRAAESFHGRGEPDRAAQKALGAMLAEGEVIEVQVQGWKAVQYALGSDAQALGDLNAGRLPEAWSPLGPNTTDEAVFLAPLDPVSARGRAKELFGFDYVWEVYKPEPQRKYGYYALPVLWGDRLVARFDSKLDRSSNTFIILGLWLDDETLADNEAFAEALAGGFMRFAAFLGARRLEAGAIGEPWLRTRLSSIVIPPGP
jgi:uncharacterized protein